MTNYEFSFFSISDVIVEDFNGISSNKEDVHSYGSNTRHLTFKRPDILKIEDDDPNFDDDDGNAWGPIPDEESAQAIVASGPLPVGMAIDNESSLVWVDADTGIKYTMLIVSKVDQYGTSKGVVGFAFVGGVPPIGVRLTLDNMYPNTPYLNTSPNFRYEDLAVCFAAGTLIETEKGPLPVENLIQGSLVLTVDNGLQNIRWIGSRSISSEALERSPNLIPIRISKNSLGKDMPTSDLLVSPQHRILVRSKIAQRMFGNMEVIIAAKHLCGFEGIDVAEDVSEVLYYHILLDRHEIIIANGARAESLFIGPVAKRALGKEALDEIYNIFPELNNDKYHGKTARLTPSGSMGRNAVIRHKKNSKALVNEI